MIITAVESSTLKTIAYDESRALLRLEFRSLAVYDYGGVPSIVHDALREAPSKGGCFNQVVRGRFPFCRVGGADGECAPEGVR